MSSRHPIVLPFSVSLFALIATLLMATGSTHAQTRPEAMQAILNQRVQSPDATAFQVQRYLMRRIPKSPAPSTAEEWSREEQRLRKHVLEDVVLHGWPSEWVEAPPRFEQTGVIETSKGYRLRKFRYEIVPGFQSTAILYEPQRTTGRVPGILNVIGHEPAGNAAEYEQKRCINFAKRGIYALSLGWMGFGELAQPENAHDFAAYLDLVGANSVGLFYLSMRRGLDYLAGLPQVDPKRLGVTGLSGGGWQTVLLSALDERVAVSVEVAGIGSLESNLTHPMDTDEVEQNAADLTDGQDYPYFIAMRAPRPTLLIHNAEDDCCFRAGLVKPYIFDRIRPVFEVFGRQDVFGWHENRDPGTHNYQRDNREQAYKFFDQHFGVAAPEGEIPSDSEVRNARELAVGVAPQNLTIAGVARKLAGQITRPTIPETQDARAAWAQSQRAELQRIVRYRPVSVTNAWRIVSTKQRNLETLSYRFDFANELSASGVWLKAIATPANAPAVIVLNDKGYKAAAATISQHVNRGEQVLALDVLFNGASVPQEPQPADWQMFLTSTGDRALGIQVSQLLALAHWVSENTGRKQVSVETNGIRSQVMALVAAALEPEAFSLVDSHAGMNSLRFLLDKPIPFRSAPELFCLDLYKNFDLDRLTMVAAPTKVQTTNPE